MIKKKVQYIIVSSIFVLSTIGAPLAGFHTVYADNGNIAAVDSSKSEEKLAVATENLDVRGQAIGSTLKSVDMDGSVSIVNKLSGKIVKSSTGEKIALKSEKVTQSMAVKKASTTTKVITSQVIWPLRGNITSYFGPRSRDNHPGIDIGAPIGTSVKSAVDGQVVFSGWEDGYGKFVIVQNANGLQTCYGHLSQSLVNVGQAVSAGQVIAKVGMTGRTTGPHLHFEVRRGGKPVDPLIYLK